ncbi:MAG: hypothetical protein IS632_00590 [Thaumarchaeota archaeon]|nr:hypothetical protein [Nitrososphaerota archaeon]
MAKERRAGDPWKSRLFKMSTQSDLTELRDRGFDNERQVHGLIERNIGTMFPGLELLETEFRGMARGALRPDTIAFDTTRNTFVALEYKNRLNKEVVDQARTYLNLMRQHQAELILSHSKNMGCSPRDEKSFNWKKMYAIIMAPEFGDYQIIGADEDPTMEMYEIGMYDDSIMLVERVGGDHEGTSAKAARTPAKARAQRSPADQIKSAPAIKLARVTISKGSSVPGCEKTNGCYVPHTVTIDVGGEVVWTNDDPNTHTVTSGVMAEGGPDGVFDSGPFVFGAEFSHTFETAGEYPYFDLTHPWMRGVVIVKE